MLVLFHNLDHKKISSCDSSVKCAFFNLTASVSMSVITAAMECHMTGATERLLATSLLVDSERHHAFIKGSPSLPPAKSKVGQRKTAGHCAALHPCVSTFCFCTPASAHPPTCRHMPWSLRCQAVGQDLK